MTDLGQLTSEMYSKLSKLKSEEASNVVDAVLTLLGTHPKNNKHQSTETMVKSEATFDDFFEREGAFKESDNALLCAAYHFHLYGNASFSVQEMKCLATKAGIILPNRTNMTLTAAKRKGKKLFCKEGRGLFKPTAAAGVFFREKWNVRPGKQKKIAEE